MSVLCYFLNGGICQFACKRVGVRGLRRECRKRPFKETFLHPKDYLVFSDLCVNQLIKPKDNNINIKKLKR